MSKFIVGVGSDSIYQALYEAGVVREQPGDCSRVIIDLKVGEPARIYIDRYADSVLTDVIFARGFDIVARPAEENL